MDILLKHLGVLYPKFEALKSRTEGDILIVSNDGLELFYFNETAASFCCKADGTKTLSEIIALMQQEYEVDQEELTSDILNLVRELQWSKVLQMYRSAQ